MDHFYYTFTVLFLALADEDEIMTEFHYFKAFKEHRLTLFKREESYKTSSTPIMKLPSL